jgi:pimeloyl-ACP methyl ester carboxylesterase
MPERTIEVNGIRLWTEDFGVIHGTDDPILPYPHGEALAAAIPGAKLLAFDGMGHDVPVQVRPEIIREMFAVTQRACA